MSSIDSNVRSMGQGQDKEREKKNQSFHLQFRLNQSDNLSSNFNLG